MIKRIIQIKWLLIILILFTISIVLVVFTPDTDFPYYLSNLSSGYEEQYLKLLVGKENEKVFPLSTSNYRSKNFDKILDLFNVSFSSIEELHAFYINKMGSETKQNTKKIIDQANVENAIKVVTLENSYYYLRIKDKFKLIRIKGSWHINDYFPGNFAAIKDDSYIPDPRVFSYKGNLYEIAFTCYGHSSYGFISVIKLYK